ncbi:MAG: DUF2974 domain-containing protein [Coriobacteriales bacterium]|jgi:hypothetical protein|nr:DUF2974 domain-containing protein [Coriobacteriales bacterium]
MLLSDNAATGSPEIYSHQELDNASILAYDDYGLVVRRMQDKFDYENRDYTLGEIYEFAQDPANNCQQYVQWTNLCLTEGGLDWEEVQDWKLVDYSDPDINVNQGFSGCVFETSPGHAIVACRGSESLEENLYQDWYSAFKLPYSQLTPHQQCAEDYAQRLAEIGFGERYPYLAVTGQSLGGNDAEHLTVVAGRFGLTVSQCVCFDAPGNSLAHNMLYQSEFNQVKDVITYIDYSWASSGGIRFFGANIILAKRKPWSTYPISPDRTPSDIGEVLGGHSPVAISFDDDGMVVVKRVEDIDTFDYYYVVMHCLSLIPVFTSVFRLDFWLRLDFSFWRLVYSPFTPESIKNYLTLSGESSTNTREAQTQMTDWLGKQLMEHFARVGRSNTDYGEYLTGQAQGPSIRSLVSASGIADRLSMPEGSRRRDFSDATRGEMLAIIDGLLADAPLDASHYVEWDEFERECKRLVPEAFPYFQSMLDFNDTFEQSLKTSKAEINRIFDEAIAIDSAHAEKISGINDQLRQLKEGLHEMTASLESASAKIGSIG